MTGGTASRAGRGSELVDVVSADGTPIACEAWGEGQPVVVVGGALDDRGDHAGLARALAARGLRAASYDRRGRGDSGDTLPYAVQREVEDLQAVLAAVGTGGPAFAHGVSSGAALLLTAVAQGLPVTRVSVFEPPYRGTGAPPLPDEHVATLSRLAAAGDRAGLLAYAATVLAGPPAGVPVTSARLALAPTLLYDALVMGGDDHALPADTLARVGVPVLAVTSTGTALPWLSAATVEAAAAVPSGRCVRLAGGPSQVPPAVLAPALAAFYRGG